MNIDTETLRLPRWMKAKMPKGESYSKIKNLIHKNNLNTICTSGNCPNKGECWNAGTATFMILGNACTRHCKFCYVRTLKPAPVDWQEPMRVADTISTLGLKHCVITSVNRDDLQDGGASFWATTIRTIKEVNPDTTIEVLVPDFLGNEVDIQTVINAKPEVISHNLETIKRLTPRIRSRAKYERSLKVLKYMSDRGVKTKSGIMLGLGENLDEVLEAMQDLRNVGVKILTIGQYLSPSPLHAKVERYVHPDEFDMYHEEGLTMGFSFVESGPLVRSSYHAERHVNA